jgi:hypothetical protein
MKPWLGRTLVISLCLVSCGAKSAPTRITLKALDTYSGPVRLSPCENNAADPVLIDAHGNGKTAACPLGGDVEFVVVKPSRTIYISREHITVARAGDGFPVSITAAIP